MAAPEVNATHTISTIPLSEFIARHIGPHYDETIAMLQALNVESLQHLMELAVPEAILNNTPLSLDPPCNEASALSALQTIARKNQLFKSYIGLGYHPTVTPAVIERNVLQNPGWYTAYTPYQAEISQGRLEGLLNFQQMIIDLTAMDMANASLLDEATAAAEAMALAQRHAKKEAPNCFFVANDVHPQTIAVVKTRALRFGIDIVIGDPETELSQRRYFGVLLQYPGSTGQVRDLTRIIDVAHQQQALVTVAADLLSMLLLKAPGQMGADIVVGSSQRFGVPMAYGGPNAAFFAFRESLKRLVPGRIIGVSKDSKDRPALRMAMQTREQHIRREKATSNICTAQVLLALISAFYAIYHGPQGLKAIASRVHQHAHTLATRLQRRGYALRHTRFFDTVVVLAEQQQLDIYRRAQQSGINLRKVNDDALAISLHEGVSADDVDALLNCFPELDKPLDVIPSAVGVPAALARTDAVLSHPVFNQYHSETAFMRYLKRLESKDIALNQSMIPLGSCTMKLNAAAEMIPITWPEFSQLHPFAPREQAEGYAQLFDELETMLKACTGYAAISLQPNAGSQGEYAGLIAIKRYFDERGEQQRRLCLIPQSAHGTNPASAHMAGLEVLAVRCDDAGNVDVGDLRGKVQQHGTAIAAIMLTYPSTHGVYESAIRDICDLVHSVGAQVYIDGANLNALVGVAAPGQFGGDVSHLNLHKTFCIPHGGGGPGVGPIGVAEHLAPYLPGHPFLSEHFFKDDNQALGSLDRDYAIAAAPWGSAGILPISWMYITMMGSDGLRIATEYAVLNANYMAKRLQPYFPVLYRGRNDLVAHECIIDLRPLTKASGISEEDVAKRLMDFGFHAPTMSFPVPGTLMIEPTESESKEEMDKFIEAMIVIRKEIDAVIDGTYPADDNPLVNAPHTVDDVLAEDWQHCYPREVAARPASFSTQHKYWPPVNRIDSVYGDRHLFCSCDHFEQP